MKKNNFQNSRGQIQIIILAVVIILGILLSGYGIPFKKSRTDQTPISFDGGNQNPVPETFTSTGTCCDKGDGDQCTLTSDCFNFRGSDYCKIKSNVSIYDAGWMDIVSEKHNGKDIYINVSETAGECGSGGDQIFNGDQCYSVPNEEMIYVCTSKCPTRVIGNEPGSYVLVGGGQAGYDVYFRSSDTIPDVIKNCSKNLSSETLPTKKKSEFQKYLEELLKSKITPTVSNPNPASFQNNPPQNSNTPKNSLQFGKLDFTPPQKQEEAKKQVEKTLAPWFSPYCKPAIYLYPETLSLINVKVVSNQPFTYTDPPYPDNGWNVLANPNGLINYGNRFYDYLYYETQVLDSNIKKPEEGFIVERKNIKSFLFSLLPKVGLNPKETIQFSDYWDSALLGSPYYFIGIITPKNLDSITSLAITPKPKTIIRVTLYFEALDKKTEVKSPKISTSNRTGFTVVEWGGIYKKHKNEAFSCFL